MNQIARRIAAGDVISPADVVHLIGQPHPFESRRVAAEFPEGLSIAEMLACVRAETALPHALWVWIDGDQVPPDWFTRVRPKAGTTVVFKAALHGGSTLRIVLSLAVAVAAIVLAIPTGGASLALAGALGISGATAGALIGAAVIVGGTLALNALFPTRPAQLSNQSESFTQLASIQGAQNQAIPYDAIPQILGLHQFSPVYAAKPFTELVGDDQYLRLLFCFGYGPLAFDVASFKIGTTPLSSFSDYEIEVREGYPSDAPVTLYPSSVDEQALAIELNSVDGWQTRNSEPDTDEISIDVTAPDGIGRVNTNTGQFGSYTVELEARYRLIGDVGPGTVFASFAFGRSLRTQRIGQRVGVTRGQYEVSVRKVTTDGNSEDIKDRVVWTALRSVTNEQPIAFPHPLALVALRIKATSQLNGVVDTFNGIAQSVATHWNGSSWIADQQTSNPADLYRLVLQGHANAQPVTDAEIDLDNLAAWADYCAAQGFTFNQVRGRSSVYDTLADLAAAGRAVPTFLDGKWGVVWDRPSDPIVQHFTPRNSWGLTGSRVYARLPHGWRVRFINASNGYTDDERVVYDDGYSASNATLFEGIEFPGVTDPDLIWRFGRYHIAQARLRPERIVINVDWEQLVCTRGDRVRLTHDVMLIGLAAARVKSIVGQVVTLDEVVTIEGGKTYGIRFRHPDDGVGSFLRAVDVGATGTGDTTTLTLTGDLSNVAATLLAAFGETNQDSAVYRVYAIEHSQDLIARLTLVDDAPDIATADSGTIPDYAPNITIPPDPFTLPPQHLQYIELIDGVGAAVRELVRLSWTLPRQGAVSGFEIQLRDDDGGGDWVRAAMVPAPATTADVPVTSAGVWSLRIRCLFANGTVSTWVTLAGLHLTAISNPPADVRNLREEIINGQTYLSWDAVDDPRLPSYEVRKGASFAVGLVVGVALAESKFASTGDGTYWVAAYVIAPFGDKIYSAAPISIAIEDTVLIRNVIVSHDEKAEGWPGGLQGGVIQTGLIKTNGSAIVGAPFAEVVTQFQLAGLTVEIYLSARIVDIGRAAECRFEVTYEGVGSLQGEDFLGLGDVLASPDFLGSESTRFILAYPIWRFAITGANDIFGEADIFDPTDVFSASVDWQPWVNLASGTRFARFFRAGFVLISNRADIDAVGTKFSWFVDVPDRNDDYTNLSVPDTGLSISFVEHGYDATEPIGAVHTPYNGGPNNAPLPHVQRAIVSGSNGDEVQVSALTLAGCTVFVKNAGVAVTRTGVNLLVRGY